MMESIASAGCAMVPFPQKRRAKSLTCLTFHGKSAYHHDEHSCCASRRSVILKQVRKGRLLTALFFFSLSPELFPEMLPATPDKYSSGVPDEYTQYVRPCTPRAGLTRVNRTRPAPGACWGDGHGDAGPAVAGGGGGGGRGGGAGASANRVPGARRPGGAGGGGRGGGTAVTRSARKRAASSGCTMVTDFFPGSA